MNPFTALKNLSPFHFTSLHFLFLFLFFYLSCQPFISLCFAIHIYNSLPSLITFYLITFGRSYQIPSMTFRHYCLMKPVKHNGNYVYQLP